MKLSVLLLTFAFALQPALAADDKKPEEKKTAAEKREEAKEKEKQKKREEEIKKEKERMKKEDEKKKKEEKSGLPPKPAPPATPQKRFKTDMLDEEVVAVLKPYDSNGDFEIDVEEFKAVETEFKKNPKGPLKSFDKANDGTLDAMIDRTGINVKLGAAAPKVKKTPAKKPAPAPAAKPEEKKPEEKKPEEKKPA